MAKRKRSKSKDFRPLKALFFLAQALLLLFLPFFILIRLSLFLHLNVGINPWLALLISILLTFAGVAWYLNWLALRLGRRKKLRPQVKWRLRLIAGVITGLFCTYTLLYLSAGNAKTDDIQGEYMRLHPILRLAVGTATIFDRYTVVTDLSREAEDYDDMGLSAKNRSLHYPQSDGYVHAADLRTTGRSEWRNDLMGLFFRIMGFGTLRHTGTADHLHVSLPTLERPGEL